MWEICKNQVELTLMRDAYSEADAELRRHPWLEHVGDYSSNHAEGLDTPPD